MTAYFKVFCFLCSYSVDKIRCHTCCSMLSRLKCVTLVWIGLYFAVTGMSISRFRRCNDVLAYVVCMLTSKNGDCSARHVWQWCFCPDGKYGKTANKPTWQIWTCHKMSEWLIKPQHPDACVTSAGLLVFYTALSKTLSWIYFTHTTPGRASKIQR